jgi:hypothetical protein
MHHYTQQWSVLSDTGNTCEPQLLVSLIYIHFPVGDQPTHLQFSYLLMSLQNIWSYVWHPFIATADLKCQGCTRQENITSYSYVTQFHHRPLLCSYCVWAHVQTEKKKKKKKTTHTYARKTSQTHSSARFSDAVLTDNIKPLQTTICVEGSSNIWAYPRRITHTNDEETIPIYVRSQTLQTKPYLLHGAKSAKQ